MYSLFRSYRSEENLENLRAINISPLMGRNDHNVLWHFQVESTNEK
jgi:hypothetical protein